MKQMDTYLVTVTVLVGVEVVYTVLPDPVVTVMVLVVGQGVTVDVMEFYTRLLSRCTF